jgi:hypothetical protein
VNGAVVAVDITDKTKPNIISQIQTNSANFAVLSADQKTLFLSDATGGLKIIDITNPKTLKIIGSLSTPYANYLKLSDDEKTIFVGDNYGLIIVNITSLTNPSIINTFSDYLYVYAISPIFDGKLRAIITQDYTKNGGSLWLMDFGNFSAAPTVIGSVVLNDFAQDLALTNDRKNALVAGQTHGVFIIDISNRTQPSIMTFVLTNYGFSVSLLKDGKTVALGDGSMGIKLFKIQEFALPIEGKYLPNMIGNENSFYAKSIAVSDD